MTLLKLRYPFATFSGYGKMASCFVKHLPKWVEVWPLGNRGRMPRSSGNPHVGLLIGHPDYIVSLGTDVRVMYSMYEASDVPFTWQQAIRGADEVWVPSMFCAEVFGGYNPRISILHPGVRDAYRRLLTPRDELRHSLGLPQDAWIVGTVGVMSYRKGIDLLLLAMQRAFPNDRDAWLAIKTRDTRWLPALAYLNPNVIIFDEDWDEERLVAFYNAIDLFALPSRGEGIGLPPLEAARCGTPVVTTRWGGMLEYIDDDGIWGIDVLGTERVRNMRANQARWAVPSLDHLIDMLRWFRDNPVKVKRRYDYWSCEAASKRFNKAIHSLVKRYGAGDHH